MRSPCLLLAATLGGVLACAGVASAATLTLTTNIIGTTPEILAYNSGHFLTNSNTRDWWRYAGVNGARVFLSPSEIEPSDDLAPVGDGVNNPASFLSRRAALRADPLNLSYINWAGSSVFSNRYESNDLYPNNHIKPNYTLREMRRLGLRICAQITASQSRLPIAGTNDWPNMWELWQHYYAQAFYLGRVFEVERYQMFNEPNHSNANGLTQTNFLLRLQLASDAIQAALADVNTLYGKSLAPNILAPVTSGSADGAYAGWGGIVVTNRHRNFLGQTDTNFWLIHTYDYHQYGSSPSNFGSDLANLNAFLTADLATEPRFPTAISEFNTDTGASFDTQAETLDSPVKYSRFGAICVNLLSNGCNELYAFKFSQTESDPGDTYPVQKNAMHYVDNSNSPYNVGGVTKAGEVYRLFNKAFATRRDRLNSLKGGGATSLEVHTSYDPVRNRYYMFSVNDTASSVAVDFAFTTLPVPVGNRVLLEEVSETTYGGGKLWTSVPAGKTISAGTQSANTVWLLTIPTEPQAAEQILTATDDAEVRDGANKAVNYGSATSMTARNDPANAANRSAVFMKFNLDGIGLTNIEFAILSLQASTASVTDTAQAHVYALDSTNWSQGAITWTTAPNLKQNVTAGNTIAKQWVTGAGDTAHLVGQIVVNSTNASEKLMDVTGWLRSYTNTAITFLVSQDPRWDVELPSLATGDTQPDGVKIITTEGGTGPRLRLVLKSTAAPTNSPPVATNDVYAATEDTPLIINAPGVLANDFDADTNVLSAALVADPLHGNITLNADGSFTYTPSTNYNGADSFTYMASDGAADSGAATVWLNIGSVNDVPFAMNDAATTPQNTPVIVSVLTNDSDVDGGTLAVASFTQGASGSVSNNGNGTFTYSPNMNFSGNDIFSYTITDGQGGTNSASVRLTVNAPGGTPYWTNLLATTEAFVRGGANAATDPDEVTTGYIMVKYNSPSLDNSRKAYFQFDLAGLNVAGNTQAVFTVGFLNSYKQNVQPWALNQACTNFASTVTWNAAPANETNSNFLLTGGSLNATALGAVTNIPATSTTSQSFAVPLVGNYIHGNRLTLVLSGSPDAGSFTNNSSGLRLLRTNATLQVLIGPPAPSRTNPPVITNIVANPNGSIIMNFFGETNRTHWLQATTNLAGGTWVSISTNVSNAHGAWSFTDSSATNFPQRFYRAVLP